MTIPLMDTEDAKKLTVEELLDMFPEAKNLLSFLATITHTMDPAVVVISLALLFGSMALDAEMLIPEVSLDERIDLFVAHARTSYHESAAFVKKHNIYHDPKRTN